MKFSKFILMIIISLVVLDGITTKLLSDNIYQTNLNKQEIYLSRETHDAHQVDNNTTNNNS